MSLSLVLIFLMLLMRHASEGIAGSKCIGLSYLQHKMKVTQ